MSSILIDNPDVDDVLSKTLRVHVFGKTRPEIVSLKKNRHSYNDILK